MGVPLLKTENGEQTFMLDAQTLSQLPQVGQDWSSFDILMAGAAGAPMGNQGALGTGTSNGTMLAVNGNLPFSQYLRTERNPRSPPAQTLTSTPTTSSNPFRSASPPSPPSTTPPAVSL